MFVEIYDDGNAAPHKVDIATTIRSDVGKVFFKNEEERASSELQGKRGGYGYTARIPLTGLEPGPYVLTVEARSRLGHETAASRQVRVIVGPPVTAPAAPPLTAPSGSQAAPTGPPVTAPGAPPGTGIAPRGLQ